MLMSMMLRTKKDFRIVSFNISVFNQEYKNMIKYKNNVMIVHVIEYLEKQKQILVQNKGVEQ